MMPSLRVCGAKNAGLRCHSKAAKQRDQKKSQR
jgi:hypothetical protein